MENTGHDGTGPNTGQDTEGLKQARYRTGIEQARIQRGIEQERLQKRNSTRQDKRAGDDIECTATAIPFIYSFSGNSAASAPISTFMCLWAIYIFLGSVYIFPPAEQADLSREYIIRSKAHESGNWD
jgi:hypothetical protein